MEESKSPVKYLCVPGTNITRREYTDRHGLSRIIVAPEWRSVLRLTVAVGLIDQNMAEYLVLMGGNPDLQGRLQAEKYKAWLVELVPWIEPRVIACVGGNNSVREVEEAIEELRKKEGSFLHQGVAIGYVSYEQHAERAFTTFQDEAIENLHWFDSGEPPGYPQWLEQLLGWGTRRDPHWNRTRLGRIFEAMSNRRADNLNRPALTSSTE